MKRQAYKFVASQNNLKFLLNNRKCNNSYATTILYNSAFSTNSDSNSTDRKKKNYKKNIRKHDNGRNGRNQIGRIVYKPHYTGLDVYNHPNLKRDFKLSFEDNEEDVDINAVDDSEIVENPFDLTKLKRNYVAYVANLPTGFSVTELKSLFSKQDVIYVEVVPRGRKRKGGGRKRTGYKYIKKDGTQGGRLDAFAFVYFADAVSLREAIHDYNGKDYKGKPLHVALSDKHIQNKDGEGQLAVTGGDLFYDEKGLLYVNTRNKMKNIVGATREEQAHYFPETLEKETLQANYLTNLPGKPDSSDLNVDELMDSLYTKGEKILAQHAEEASFLTTQERNIFNVDHSWNATLRLNGENTENVRKKKLREMEVTLGLTASHNYDEDEVRQNSDEEEENGENEKNKPNAANAYLNADVGEYGREQQHLQRLENFSSIVLSTGRVSVTRKAGRDMSYRCLVVAGDCMGRGGFGFGKGASMPKARDQALKDAVKNMIYIPLYEGRTLYHDLKGKHNNAKVILRARPAGSGLVAGPAVRSILDVLGIRDCTTKVFGRQNIYSTVQAVFKAFNSYEDAESIALKRGKRLIDVNEVMRENHQSIW